jgi:hypothetical protein
MTVHLLMAVGVDALLTAVVAGAVAPHLTVVGVDALPMVAVVDANLLKRRNLGLCSA